MKVRSKCVIGLMLGIITLHVSGQTPDHSGVWILKQKHSISGKDYANGIPKKMKVRITADSMIMERVYDGGLSNDYAMNDALPLNGNTMSIVSANRKRESVVKSNPERDQFLIEVKYTDTGTGKESSSYVEKWNVDKTDKELRVEKMAKGTNGDSWRIDGVYTLLTGEQLSYAQETGKGIQFIEDVSWDEIKARAKKESKFIFVDCFATWCLPCKKMEKEIFPLNMVGAQMNSNFICLRLQMDTSKKDDEKVKAWYSVSHDFLTKYNLAGYPTFLFFNTEGDIVHKGLGTYKADEFIELLQEARNPYRQYYTMLKKYETGEREKENLFLLILTAQKLGETKQVENVLGYYKKTYLDKLPMDSLLSVRYLKLANDFQSLLIRKDGSKGNYFKLMYRHGKEVDRISNLAGFSTFYVNGIITKEEIEDKIYDKGKPLAYPSWKKITDNIKRKFDKADGDRLVLDAQIRYYSDKKDWTSEIKYLVDKIGKYGVLSLGFANGSGSDNAIVNVLLPHCDDQQIINKAVTWMEQIIQSDAYKYPVAMVYGNYGGILYKAGRQIEGIEAFEKHLKAIGYTGPENIDKDPRFKPKVEVLARMKRGDKIDSTWNPGVFN